MTDDIMKWFCISLVFLITVLPSGHGHYGSSRQEDNSEKLSTLEKQVKVLTNELLALKEDVKVLKGETSPEPDPDILPLEASRTMRPGGRVRFTLKYKAKPAVSDRVKVFWIDTSRYQPIQESMSNEIPRLPPDVYLTSIETEASDTNHVSVSVGTHEFWYRINIKNALEGNAIQRITSLPEGQVTPSGDIVYKPGTNASLKLTGPLEDQGPADQGFSQEESLDFQFYINPPGSDDILEKYGHDDVLENFVVLGDEQLFLDKREVNLIFNTSVVAYSGLLMAMLGKNYHNDLVFRIEKNYMMALRPSNQSGAFREGLLALRGIVWGRTNDNGDYVERCSPDELCRFYCQVFGNNQNQIVVLRTVNGVAETVIPASHEEGQYFSYVMETFHMTSDPNPVNYTCIGSNADGQRVVSTHLFYLDNPPTFVEDETSIEVTPDLDVIVTCTATGSPLPFVNITFSSAMTTELEHTEGNREVLYQTTDTISVSKVINLSDAGPGMRYALEYQPYAMFATCSAYSTNGESDKTLYISDQLSNVTMSA